MKRCPACQRDYPDQLEACPEDSTRLPVPFLWSVGAVVRGRYEILEALGGDRASEVFKAHDRTLGEWRAIRVLRLEFATRGSVVKPFKHLAALARRLQHPAIVRVEAAEDADDGRPFLVMEYVAGRDLGEALDERAPLPPTRACYIARQVAGALEVAHRLGLLHRQLDPAHIRLLAAPGGERVKVLGFGMARVIEGCLRDARSNGSSLEPTGLIIGTPQYGSPEQAAGKLDADLDARSDLYSLGVLLYQMLSGRLPFPSLRPGSSGLASLSGLSGRSDLDALLAHLDRAPEPLSEARNGAPPVPAALAALVARLLEKKRELRPATAQAVIEELGAIEKDLELPALGSQWELGEPFATSGPIPLAPSATEPALTAPTTHQSADAALEASAPVSVRGNGHAGNEESGRLATAPELAESAPVGAAGESIMEASGAPMEPPVRPIGEIPLAPSVAASDAAPAISERASPYSILFKPPAPQGRRRRVLKVVAAVAAVPLAVWLFAVYRPRMTHSTIHTLIERYGERPDSTQPKTPPTEPAPASSQIGQTGQPGQPDSAAAPNPSGLSGPQSSAPPVAGKVKSTSAPSQSAPVIPPPLAPPPPAPIKSGPAPKPSVDPALVKASMAEGDGFFELGDYDRAIAVYERPLKIDPAIEVLKQRVERARKAKAAEEKYLGE